MADRIYGIDLGTTYSCIAYVDEHAKPTVVPNSEGQLTTPSVAFFETADNVVVGAAAKDVAELYPDKVCSTVKRAMGDPKWVTKQHDKTFNPQEVSAFILRKLVADAELKTNDKIKDVVITCPAYFGVSEREATRQAALLADLNPHYVVSEPTAAAIAYSIDRSENQTVLVFDLGGGTFDVTVLSVTAEHIDVVCTGGDPRLGGKNWDETIAQWLANQFEMETGVPAADLTDNRETWQELLKSAEAAKIALSSRTSHTQRVQHDINRAVVTLTRDKFDELTSSNLLRTLSLTDELLNTAREKGHERIDKLLLVGGSTFMPQVKTAVEERFPFEVTWADPNEAVAKGAALMGFKCKLDSDFERWVKERIAEEKGVEVDAVSGDEVEETLANDEELRTEGEKELAVNHGMALPGIQKLHRKTIRNVTSKSFGVVVVDKQREKYVNNLIVIDDAVPTKIITRRYGTSEDDSSAAAIVCVENSERHGPDGDPVTYDPAQEIGKATLEFSRSLPKGSPVEISFSLTEDGRLDVHGRDCTTDQEVAASFKSDAILTLEEIEEKKERSMSIAVV